MAKIGYMRVSTSDQSLDIQRDALTCAGCDKLFGEKESGAKSDRPQLNAMLEYAREGDTVTVTRLDRLARSIRDLLQIVDIINNKGAALQILNMNIDTGTASGKLMLSIFAALGEFERDLLLERQAEGIARAKVAKKYKGRLPVVRGKIDEIRAMLADGLPKTEIGKKLGCNRDTIARAIKWHKQQGL